MVVFFSTLLSLLLHPSLYSFKGLDFYLREKRQAPSELQMRSTRLHFLNGKTVETGWFWKILADQLAKGQVTKKELGSKATLPLGVGLH